MNFYDVKEDWTEVKKRWRAWWEFDLHDRPLLLLQTRKNNPRVPPEFERFEETSDWERKYCDPGHMVNRVLHQFYHTYYGGEAIPVIHHGWSVGHAVPFGCHPNFAADTVWTDTVPVREGRTHPEVFFDEDNKWWKMLLSNTEKMARASGQRYWVMPMWGNHAGDNLSLIRGNKNLLYDCVDNPEWVRQSIRYITDAMQRQFEELQKFSPLTGMEGTTNYVNCWSPGLTYGFDCDFSCMISPEIFRGLFLPPLVEMMRSVDHCIYHLDGAVALHHLDTLLDVKEINAIQWLPGAGREEITQWIPLLQKMQSRKKSVLCYADVQAIPRLLKELRPEGLCICAWVAGEDDARRLCDDVAKMYRITPTTHH